MKQRAVLFARGVIYLLSLAAVAVCFILLPELAREESVGKPVNLMTTYGFLVGIYILSIPFFVALNQTLKLLHAIDNDQTFSERSVKRLQNIKNCVVLFIILLIAGVITGISVSRFADPREDVTFMITLGGIVVFVSSVIAVFIAVLQKLLREAMNVKSENDLIV